MSYEVTYIDGLQGTWIAQPIPTATAPIVPYSRGRDGGFAYQAPRTYQPPVGSPTAVLDLALEAETYVTPTGARAWKPTAADEALVDAVTQNPYTGLDELVEAGGRGAAGQGFKNLPYVGDVVGGAVEGASVYGRTGSVTHGVFAGVGSSIGGVAGTAIGASLGAVGGPVGIAVGGLVGGAVGSAFGSAAGQALANLLSPLPPANVTGAEQFGDIPFTGGQSAVAHTIKADRYSLATGVLSQAGQTIAVSAMGPLSRINNPSNPPAGGCITGSYSPGTSIKTGTGSLLSLSGSGCSQHHPQFRNVKVTRNDGLPDIGGDPPKTTEPYKPTIETPVAPKTPGFRLPIPIPRVRPNPTLRPTENPTTGPTGTPFGMPKPITGIPTLPKITAPGDYPTDSPHDDPYPNPDPTPTGEPSQPNEDSEECDPCVELKAIRAQLDQTFSLAWSLPECETEFLVNRTGEKNGQGLAGLNQKIDGLHEILKVLHSNTRCKDEIIVGVPDDYGRSPETNRPTLILFYKEKTGQKWNRSTYTTTIFYPKSDVILGIFDNETLIPPPRNIGNGFATLTLPDSSKLRAFGITEAGAISTISWMAQYCMLVPNNWQTKIVSGTRHGLSNKLVYPRKAEYYVTGFKAEAVPDKKITFGNAI